MISISVQASQLEYDVKSHHICSLLGPAHTWRYNEVIYIRYSAFFVSKIHISLKVIFVFLL